VLSIHQVNLQPSAGGGEVYTRSLTRALAQAGAHVSLYVSRANRFWDGLGGERIDCIGVEDEAGFLERLPSERSVVLTQGPLSPRARDLLAARHRLTGFAHMPMHQRRPDEFLSYRLVFSVSRYCIALLREAGLERIYPEPVYGAADLARGDAPVTRRSPYDMDRRKLRDRLLAALGRLTAGLRAPEPFRRAPGLTLGIVSLLSPIKQLPQLFTLLAPALARHPSVRLEVFGEGGYAQVRDLRRALAPLAGAAGLSLERAAAGFVRVADEQVAQAILPAHDGLIGILTDRAPLLVKLGKGPLRIDLSGGEKRYFYIEGGIAQMKDNRLTVVTQQALLPEEINSARACSDVISSGNSACCVNTVRRLSFIWATPPSM